jgi:hemerythrin-like domain-containing protein
MNETSGGQMNTRRTFLITGATLLIASPDSIAFGAKEAPVTATEDLMREHGIIRRCLLIYASTVSTLRVKPESIDAAALRRTGQLFRTFGEDYHEKQLEEQHIFPVIRKMKGVARYADVLTLQHQRGREITGYLLAVTNAPRISVGHAASLATALEGLVRMYEHHAAREDTIVFPAWKSNYTEKQLDELSEQFEDIEKKTFGKDGFDDAAEKVGAIEETLGLADIAQFTPPPPPKP